ncbi:MAG: TolC family protein [Chitinophagales bacterium]
MNQYLKIGLMGILLILQLAESNAQTLEELFKRAVEHNPELSALQLEYEAALQKGPQVRQLGDLQIGVAAPILRPETRLGAQVVTVSASQMFPWFGTLKAKEDVAISMAQSKFERVAAIQADLFYQIKSAYYQLYLIEQEQAVIQEILRLTTTMENVALGKVESGKTIASDVLKIQLKAKQLENQMQLLENNKAVYWAQINEAMNQPLEDSIYLAQSFNNKAELEYLPETLQKMIEEKHPMINQLNWQLETSNKELELNKLAGMPSFGVGLDYIAIQPRTDMMPVDNGRDILIPKVMMTIPINRKKYKAKTIEETLNQEALELKKETLVNKLLSTIQAYKIDYDNALVKLEFYEDQMEVIQSTYNILLSEYSSKGVRFDELIGIQDDLLDYKLKILMAYLDTHLAVAKIDRLTKF